MSVSERLQELSESFMDDILGLVTSYDSYTDEQLDEEIKALDEEIAELQEKSCSDDEEMTEGGEPCEECGKEPCECEEMDEQMIKASDTKQGKMKTSEKKDAERYRRKNKNKLERAARKRKIANKARDQRIAKKKEMLKKQGKDDKYTINVDGKKVKKKSRRN